MTTQTIPDSLACKECEDKGDGSLSPAPDAMLHAAGSQCFVHVGNEAGTAQEALPAAPGPPPAGCRRGLWTQWQPRRES